MKSFSQELKGREYKFEIGDEVFEWRELPWDDLQALAQEEEEFAKIEDPSSKDAMDFTVKRILFFLSQDTEQQKRFKTLLKRKDNPVPYFQVEELHGWLWENVSGRPTQPLPASSNGPGSNEATSQDE